MLPFLVYVEHRKSEYKWEMYMWMLWIKNRKKEFLEYRYVFLWDSFSLLKILENEEKYFEYIIEGNLIKIKANFNEKLIVVGGAALSLTIKLSNPKTFNVFFKPIACIIEP